MRRPSGDQLLPTELIGSYALPSWLHVLEERASRGDLGELDLQEALDDAVRIALLDQIEAGVDVVTDGEMRRRDFIQGFYQRLTGLEQLPPRRAVGATGYDQNPRYRVVGPIAAPGGLGTVAEALFLEGQTNRPIKVCVPGPVTLALPLLTENAAGWERALAELTDVVNREMLALERAGAGYLQVDEPRFAARAASASSDPRAAWGAARLIEVFNATRAGVSVRVGLHACFGNFRGRSRDRRDYSFLIPELRGARCDQIDLEFANREFAQVELLARIPEAMDVGAGVVDVKSLFVETAEEVAAAVRQVLLHVSAERLVVTPDCGFNHTPRHIARAKLDALVSGARLVRAEL